MPYADLDAEGIWVQTQHTEKALIKQVPGARFSAAQKLWRVPQSWAAMVILRGVFGSTFNYGDALASWVWQERQARVDPATLLRAGKDGDSWIAEYVGANRLRPYQESGVRWLLQAGNAVLADDMGLGKTIQTLAALHMADKLGWNPLPALVICPSSVKINWARHAATWFPGATPHVLPAGTAKGRKALAAASTDPTALVITNFEAVRSFSRLAPYGSVKLRRCRECDKKFGDDIASHLCHVHPKELNGFGFRFVVVDEIHRIINAQAQQTRAIWSTIHDPSVVRRWGLTGTPIVKHAGDLWSIMHAVEPIEWPTRGQYLERYVLYEWNQFAGQDPVALKAEHRTELFSFLDPRFRRMTGAAVDLQLPPKVRTTRWVTLPTAQRKAYDSLRDSLSTMYQGTTLIAQNHLVASTRLMQFASGSVEVIEKPDPDDVGTWKISIKEPSPKMDVFEEVLDELGVGHGRTVPIVVSAEHKPLLALAAARLEKRGVLYGMLTGDVLESERQRVLDELQAGRLPVLLFTGSAGGTGVDMFAADTLINLQRSWSLTTELQREARVHRIGSERHSQVQIIDLITRDTVEEKQITAVIDKLRRLDEITRDRLSADPATVADLDAEEARILGSAPTRLEEII